MSEEKNIERSQEPQDSCDKPGEKEEQHSTGNNQLAASEPQTSNIKSETKPATSNQKPTTENMETHAHHLHKAPGKNFWHYFFEFFMLFLAVFCGFLVENYREHIVEHEREKQYIQSLIADLRSDQQTLTLHNVRVQSGASMMDSMIAILNTPSLISNNTGKLYYWARIAPRLNPLSTNDRTFEQLKNSGNFRLIRDINTSNKIMTYYEKFPLIRLLESINETEFNEYKKIAAKIFDPAVFLKMEGSNGEIKRTNENPSFRTTDNELLQELSVFSVYMLGTKRGILAAAQELKNAGSELLEYLEKEYHLE
jgi:hypothetical protein